MGIKFQSEELKEKLRIGRAKYWAERKAFPPKTKDGEVTVVKAKALPIERYSHRDFVVTAIAAKKRKLIEAQLDVAIGYNYVDEKGKKIYTKQPNASTGEYLLNQLIGKPKESIEVKEEIRLNVDI